MSLSNLLAIQRLQRFEASPQGVQRLLARTRLFLQTKFPHLIAHPP